MSNIQPIIMPKWGLAMTEGAVTYWWKKPGDRFNEGDDLVDIETSKINNVSEAPFAGRLARIVAAEGETVPVGGLIAVAAEEDATEAEINAFVAQFQSNFVPEPEGDANGGMTLEAVTIEGRDYRVGRIGDLQQGAPIVLVHGFSGDLNNWLFNIDAAAAKAPVLAIDLPGHGGSTKAVQTGGVGELAAAVAGVLAKLGVNRCQMVGHSLGGAVAMRVALDHPDLVQGLVLIAPAELPGSSVDAGFTDGVVAAQTARQLTPVLAKLFSDPSLATREMAEDVLKSKRLDGADEALGRIAASLQGGQDLAQLAGRLDELPPTTLVLGTQDQIVSRPDLAALPRSWRVVELDAGHMPHLEKAAETNTVIAEAISAGG